MNIASEASDAQCEAILSRIRPTFDVEFESMDVDGRILQILGITNMQAHIDSLIRLKKIHNPLQDLPLWAKVWPAALILGRFLRKYDPTGKNLLEVGAGTGVCGLIASGYGFSKVTLTDVENMALEFSRANIFKNNLQDRVEARYLDLCDQDNSDVTGHFDIIAASELLYLDKLHRPLLKLLQRRLASNGKALFCTDRARLKPHFKKLAQTDFKVEEGNIGVKSCEADGTEQRRVYNILILERN